MLHYRPSLYAHRHLNSFLRPFPLNVVLSGLDKFPESIRITVVIDFPPVIPLRFNGDFYCLMSICDKPVLDTYTIFFYCFRWTGLLTMKRPQDSSLLSWWLDYGLKSLRRTSGFLMFLVNPKVLFRPFPLNRVQNDKILAVAEDPIRNRMAGFRRTAIVAVHP